MRRKDEDDLPPPRANGLFDRVPKPNLPAKPLEVPTGLSDESDAHRYIAKRFNTGFSCRKCDAHWEEQFTRCPICNLGTVDSEFDDATEIEERLRTLKRLERMEAQRLRWGK